MKKQYLTLTEIILFMLSITPMLSAQTILGPSPVETGVAQIYSCNPGYIVEGPLWTATNATLTPVPSQGTNYKVTVTWNTPGNQSITFNSSEGQELYPIATKPVIVTAPCPVMSQPIGTGASRCGSGQLTLSGTPGSNANSIRWYNAAQDGSLLHTGVNYTPNLNTSTTYYITSYNSNTGCESTGNRVAVVATIHTRPAAPVVPLSPASRCGPGVVHVSGAMPEAILRWYTASQGGTHFAQDIEIFPNLSQNTTYYLAAYDNITGCESETRSVRQVVINPIPTVSVSSPSQTICSGQSTGTVTITNPNAIPSTTFSWTVSAPNITGASAGSGASFTQMLSQSTSVNQVATYTIIATANSCQSTSVQSIITVKPTPTATASPDFQSRCSAQAMTPISITNPNAVPGTIFNWTVSAPGIAGASNGSGISINQNLTHNAETYENKMATYTITPTANGCAGSPVVATVTIRPLPTISVNPLSQTICAGDPMSAITITMGNQQEDDFPIGAINWTVFAPNITGATNGSGNSIDQVLNQISVQEQTATYTITPMGSNLCAGNPVNATVTLKPKPVAAASSQTICSGETTHIEIANSNEVQGTTFNWTTSSNDITGASAGSGSLIAQTLYNHVEEWNAVTYIITPVAGNECHGNPLYINATLKPAVSPLISSEMEFSRCGSGIVEVRADLIMDYFNPLNYRWYTVPNGGTHFDVEPVLYPFATEDTTYYVSAYDNITGCESVPRAVRQVIIEENPLPPMAEMVDGKVRFGAGSLVLDASGDNLENNYQWYDAPADGSLLYTGTSYHTPSVQESTANYVYITSVSGGQDCESPRTPVDVTILETPEIITSSDYIAKGEPVTLNSSLTQYDAYSWKRGDVEVGNETSYETNQAGTYTLTVTHMGASYTTPGKTLSNQWDDDLNTNYIITRTAQRADLVGGQGLMNMDQFNNLPIEKLNESIQYFDGLGRPIQTVITQGSPDKKDIVQPVEYDAVGRQHRQYLPVVPVENNGRYKVGIIDNTGNYVGIAAGFYNTPDDAIADDPNPYAETIFEPSPLNRVLKQGAPGSPWQPDSSVYATPTDHSVKYAYEFNAANEVLLWKYTYPSVANPMGLVNAGASNVSRNYYPANELYKTKTKDEHNNEVIEYTDKQGRLILKRVQAVAGSPSVNDTNYAGTYYIYDDFGNRVTVLPPEAVRLLTQSNPVSEYFGKTDALKKAFLKRWAYCYTYDGRRRVTQEQLPGAEPVYKVYDNRDRLVLTQDGKQRAGATDYWTFTKYDELNRPIATGIKDTIATREAMQQAVDNHYAKNWTRWGERYAGNAPGAVHGYTNLSYPVVTTAATLNSQHYLTVTYYDNYAFRDLWTDASYTYQNEGLSAMAHGVEYNQAVAEFQRVSGLITGTKTKVLDGGVQGGYTWLRSTTYYDDKYRVIQTLTDNYTGGTDRVSNVYDFVGNVLKTKTTHSSSHLTWVNQVKVTAMGNKLEESASSNAWGQSGAASQQQLPANQDGWLEATASETNGSRMIGLSDTDVNQHYNTIDYAYYLAVGNILKVYENGVVKATINEGYNTGDRLKITRTGTTIRYYKNNQLMYTSLIPSSSVLMADAAFYTGSLVNVRSSFTGTSHTILRRFDYDHAGRLLNTWHSLNGGQEMLLSHNEYNKLGQLIDKKLHSTVANASDATQSVDYRYNIRGWLTSINNAQLANDLTNDDTNDYFGMELAYNQPLGIGNEAMYNGNISATKWSTNLAMGDTPTLAYLYNYDPMNRLLAANMKENENGIWSAAPNGAYSESGLSYDLNGNIKTLQRRAADGALIDNLTYTYGVANTTSNKLLRVTDAADNEKGFREIDHTADDYSYDTNGNMTWDRNKGGQQMLKNESFDEGSTHWTLNNPGRLSFVNGQLEITGGQSSSYIQQTGMVRYKNYYIIELDVDMPNNPPGGILTINLGGANTNITTSGVKVLAMLSDNQTYFRISFNSLFVGTIRSVSLKAQAVVSYNYLNLSEVVAMGKESIRYIYDANGSKLAQVVYDLAGMVTKETDYAGEFLYENDTLRFIHHEEGRIIPFSGEGGEAEYQYHLKDHLGNVRMTFTTKEETESATATMETANENEEIGQFLYYDEAVKVNSALFDHTNSGGTQYATRLSGHPNERTGLAKSLSVMPGDTVHAEVYAKYLDTNSSNWTQALTDLMAAIVNNVAPPGTVIDGGLVGSTGGVVIPFGGLLAKNNEDDGAPKAYLNYLIFDREYNLLNGGFVRVTEAAREYGQDGAHEKLEAEFVITAPGYVYIYLSNDNEIPVDVYFDDFKVTHTKSPVIQQNSFYPFGLTFDSYQRENSTENRFLYNQGTGEKTFKTERVYDLGLNVDQSRDRTYDYITGRWWQVDPKADQGGQEILSPYNYSYNNPVRYNDPFGDCPTCWQSFVTAATATYAKYSNILSPAVAPTQRLVSGNSGSTPSDIGMDSQTRSIVKVTGIAQDVNTVVETGKNAGKEVVKDVGDVADKGGEALSDAGLVAAPFTEGASLALVPIGETVSASGKGLKGLVHLGEGDNKKAAVEGGNILFGLATNSLTSTAVKESKKVGTITNAKEETITETVLGGIGSFLNKVVDYFSHDKD